MPPQTTDFARKQNAFEMVPIFALLATVVMAVFFVFPSDSVPFLATKSFLVAAGAILSLALFILLRLGRNSLVLPPLPLLAALWIPAVAYALSAAFSPEPFSSALWGTALESDTFGFLLACACLGTVAALALRRVEHYRFFLKTLFAALVALIVVQAAAVIAGQFPHSFIVSAFSITGSSSDLATLFGLGVLGAFVGIRFFSLGRRARLALCIVALAALLLLALINFSLSWILLGLFALAFFVEAIMHRALAETKGDSSAFAAAPQEHAHFGTARLALPFVALVVALFFFFGGPLSGVLSGALHTGTIDVRPSWQSTFTTVRGVYAKDLLFGTGPGTFGADWLAYRDTSANLTPFWGVDFSSGIGFIPTSLATTGLVGAFAWVVFLALFLVLGARALIMRAPEDPFARATAVFSFVAFSYLAAAAFFGPVGPVPLTLLFVFAGLFASTMRFTAGGDSRSIFFSKNPRAGFLIVFSLTLLLLSAAAQGYALVNRYAAAVELTRAESAFLSGDFATANAAAHSAISFSPSAEGYRTLAVIASAELSRLTSSSTLPADKAQQAFQSLLSSGINAGLTAVRLSEGDYRNWMTLGNLYAAAAPFQVSGAYASAVSAYEKARALNPTGPQIPLSLARVAIASKDLKAAEGYLRSAIALKQDYLPAIFLLSEVEVQNGNLPEALAAARAAAYFTPSDPNVLFQVGVLSAAEKDFAGAAAAFKAAIAAKPEFANARYLLAAVYAKQGALPDALHQLEAIAALSSTNAKTVEPLIAELKKGKNPFPKNLLSSPPPAVK